METKLNIDNGNTNYCGDKKHRIEIVYWDVSEYSERTQFLLCSAAVFVLYVLYGYLQELIFTVEGFKSHGWYLTLVQFGFYSVFGYADKVIKRSSVRKIPLRIYCLLALLTLGTMGFSNSSLSHLNYPTQVIFKCCKLIPVMIGSVLIQGKRYGVVDLLAAVSMSVGLSVFTLADSRLQPNFHTIGVIMISLALICDAVIGNVQEKYMKAYGASTHEVVLFSYAIGFLYLATILLLFGNINDSVAVTLHKPVIYVYALLFSLTGYLGMQVVLTLVQTCGALVAVTVTTCRKAISIIVSFLLFSKPFTIQYVWGGLLVMLGIYLNVLSKNKMQVVSSFSGLSLIRKISIFIKNMFRGHRKHIAMTV